MSISIRTCHSIALLKVVENITEHNIKDWKSAINNKTVGSLLTGKGKAFESLYPSLFLTNLKACTFLKQKFKIVI